MKSQISKLIPKGKGYNIVDFYKNGGKTKGLFARYAKEEMAEGVKTTMVQCKCCTRLVPGIIVEKEQFSQQIVVFDPSIKICVGPDSTSLLRKFGRYSPWKQMHM